MNLSNIKQINDQIYDSILLESQQNKIIDLPIDSFGIIKSLIESPLLYLFESIFMPLSEFIQAIDHKHPENKTFLAEIFTEKFFNKCQQIKKLVDYCDVNELSVKDDFVCFQKHLNDLINQSLHGLLGDPQKTKIFTRFLPDEKRWSARKFKKTQRINCKKNNVINTLDNFGMQTFYHNSNLLLNTKKDLVHKKENMYSMGCTKICKEIESNISEIEEFFSLQKYGFHRTTISKIIKVLNIEHNFEQVSIRPVTDSEVLVGTNAAKFIKLCDNFPFGIEGNWPIFDHYAEIYWEESNFSVMVGEINTKSYFICYNFEE